MANLTKEDTGVEGVIYISTVEGSHGPRVKWFPGRPQRGSPCLSVTIADVPVARNLGLPGRVADEAADRVRAWVAVNRGALTDFWTDGHAWSRREVEAFLDGLEKLA